MKPCKQGESQVIAYVYGDLDGDALAFFQKHLQTCSTCQRECEDIKQTLGFMDQRRRPDPPAISWEPFEARLKAAVRAQQILETRRNRKIWLIQSFAAVALLVLGIVLGKSVFQESPIGGLVTLVPDQPLTYTQQADAYVERSKTLLIGLMNMDVEAGSGASVDLSLQKKLSRELVSEAAMLRENYPEEAKDQLLELINDLEIILIQISHFEADGNLENLQVIREGVARSSLLLKIHLEQLQPTLRLTKTLDRAL